MTDLKTSSVKDTEVKTEGISATSDEKKSGEAPLLAGKYKSPDEVVKAYKDLETKLGEQGSELNTLRTKDRQYEAWGKMMAAYPEVFEANKKALESFLSGQSTFDPIAAFSNKSAKKDVADKDTNQTDAKLADVRQVQEENILNGFYQRYGYNNVSGKERNEKLAKLATELADLLDPSQKKSLPQILKEVSLSALPRYLEKAHFLANKGELLDKAKKAGFIDSEENREATFGTQTSSSGKTGSGVSLSQSEQEVAEKLGIPTEKYRKHKENILKEIGKFER